MGRLFNAIVTATENNNLGNTFSKDELSDACPGFASSTYKNYCNKHRLGNPSKVSEQFIRHEDGKFSINKAYPK